MAESHEQRIDKYLIYEESDRGAVLVGATLLEEAVEQLLIAFFDGDSRGINKVIKPLFDPMGPLSTFSGKCRIALAVRLIDKDQYDDLDLIRRLRNDCAHTADPVDFGDRPILERMEDLNYSSSLRKSLQRYSLVDPETNEPVRPADHELHADGLIKAGKSFFAAAVYFLVNDLQFTTEQISRAKGMLPDLSINLMGLSTKSSSNESD